MEVNFAIGPVMYGIPTHPVSTFQTTQNSVDLLLAGVTSHDLFRRSVHAVREQHARALIDEFCERRRIQIKL